MTGCLRDTVLTLSAFTFLLTFTACGGGTGEVTGDGGGDGPDNAADEAIPQLVSADYIGLDHIARISRFRSGVGHDYSDEFESCRSMKHYFRPHLSADWSAVPIFSPTTGIVSQVDTEWTGSQVRIRSEQHPTFSVILFHVDLANPLVVGDRVVAGQQLGTHIGSQTMSDIAVGNQTSTGWRLVSYFDVMTDSVFERYRARGLQTRDDAIISREARDADPLICSGETFADGGSIENWVDLN